MSVEVRPAAARSHDRADGIASWHCLSAGSHHDPDNVAFGPLVGFDEHLVEPGGGFPRHAHSGVDIVSWVLAGTLRHEDGDGRVVLVSPGMAQCQLTGSGLEHSETNPSDRDALRFVQMTLLGDGGGPARYRHRPPPITVSAGEFAVHTGDALQLSGFVHLYVALGEFVTGGRALTAGDSVRADEPLTVVGGGELLVWHLASR